VRGLLLKLRPSASFSSFRAVLIFNSLTATFHFRFICFSSRASRVISGMRAGERRALSPNPLGDGLYLSI
jgi:hypothetical protein